MKKARKRLGICLLAAVLVGTTALIRDKQMLRQELVRLHVVGASDTAEDQALKLRLKDAVVNCLKEDMAHIQNGEEAMAYLQENLPHIEVLANNFLREVGCRDTATVSLGLEEFQVRYYDTFTLPSGVYQSLRITIGAGEGKNWWCVAFPGLCLPATSAGFEEAASCAGFSDSLTSTLEGESEYELRFWLLDALGNLENFIHRA